MVIYSTVSVVQLQTNKSSDVSAFVCVCEIKCLYELQSTQPTGVDVDFSYQHQHTHTYTSYHREREICRQSGAGFAPLAISSYHTN